MYARICFKELRRSYQSRVLDGDPGDDIQDVNDLHGVEGDVDGDGPIPPVEDDHAATFVNADDGINVAWAKMVGFDLLEEDGNWGIETFSRAVLYLEMQN